MNDTRPIAAELFTIEDSHGKPRLTQPRPSDIGTVQTDGKRSRDHDEQGRFTARNRAAADRSAKRALSAPLRAAQNRLACADGVADPLSADALLADAGALYSASRRELGATSVLVLGSLVVHATETTLASYYAQRAATVGLESDLGMKLVGLAHDCETQASRAMTAALAATKALSGSRPKKPADHHKALFEAFGTEVTK